MPIKPILDIKVVRRELSACITVSAVQFNKIIRVILITWILWLFDCVFNVNFQIDIHIMQTQLILSSSVGYNVTITCWSACYQKELEKSLKLLMYGASNLKTGFHWISVVVERFNIHHHKPGFGSGCNLLLLVLLEYLSHIYGSHNKDHSETQEWCVTTASDPDWVIDTWVKNMFPGVTWIYRTQILVETTS